MDGSGLEAMAVVPAAPRPWRRFALRAGAVLGFAAGAWLLGSFAASAATPDPAPPSLFGALDSAGDAANALVTSIESVGQETAAAATGVLAPPQSGPADVNAGRPAATSPPSKRDAPARSGAVVDSRSAAPRKSPVRPPAGPAASTPEAESAVTVAVNRVREIAHAAGTPERPVRTLADPATETARAVVSTVRDGLPLAPVADNLGAVLDRLPATLGSLPDALDLPTVLRRPADLRVARAGVTLVLPARDGSPSAGGEAAAVGGHGAPHDVGTTALLVGASGPAQLPAESEAGLRKTVSLPAAASDPSASRQVLPPVEDVHVARPANLRTTADPTPQLELPDPAPSAPLPAAPMGLPATGSASAAAHGHDPVAVTARARPVALVLAALVAAPAVPAVLGQAQDPGFSPG